MIKKEEIVEILKYYGGYIDRSMSEQAVHECNFQDVADSILSKLHQPTVSDSVCDCGSNHDWFEKENNYCASCDKQIN